VDCYGKALYLLTKVNKRKGSWVHCTCYPMDIVSFSPDVRRSLYLFSLLYSTYEKGSTQVEITLSTYPKQVTKKTPLNKIKQLKLTLFYALYLLFDGPNSIHTRCFQEFYE
jgi:hypothetical protein